MLVESLPMYEAESGSKLNLLIISCVTIYEKYNVSFFNIITPIFNTYCVAFHKPSVPMCKEGFKL
jgi:hypothetical protein